MYVHGLPEFEVCTDHQPSVPMLNYKPLVEMSPAFGLKLILYCFKASLLIKPETAPIKPETTQAHPKTKNKK